MMIKKNIVFCLKGKSIKNTKLVYTKPGFIFREIWATFEDDTHARVLLKKVFHDSYHFMVHGL